MKKGFTLIELLAVIIILAAIVVIVAPIVTDLISDSKEKSNIVSIEMYGRALAQAALEYELKEDNKATTYEELEKYLKYNGDKVECSTVSIDGSNIFLDECTVDGVKVNNYSYGVPDLCVLTGGNLNEIGSKYSCEVKQGIRYNFYLISHEADGTANLILDRNICEDGTLTDADKEDKCLVFWHPETDGYGPLTAMNYLHNATKDWINIQPLNYEYYDKLSQATYLEDRNYTSFISENGIVVITSRSGNEVIIGSEQEPVRVRMPVYKENSTENEVSTFNNNNIYLFEYLSDYWNFGDAIKPKNHIDGIDGYWTISTGTNEWFSLIYYVSTNGYVTNIPPYNDPPSSGVRPVINVKLQ